MAREKDSLQKVALREMMGNYLKENNVRVEDGTDVNSIIMDMMSIILESALDREMDEELGYSKYDYRNKEIFHRQSRQSFHKRRSSSVFIIHQIQNITKFVSYKEIKTLMVDLKRAYVDPKEEIVLAKRENFDKKWECEYPKIAKSWKDSWTNLSI